MNGSIELEWENWHWMKCNHAYTCAYGYISFRNFCACTLLWRWVTSGWITSTTTSTVCAVLLISFENSHNFHTLILLNFYSYKYLTDFWSAIKKNPPFLFILNEKPNKIRFNRRHQQFHLEHERLHKHWTFQSNGLKPKFMVMVVVPNRRAHQQLTITTISIANTTISIVITAPPTIIPKLFQITMNNSTMENIHRNPHIIMCHKNRHIRNRIIRPAPNRRTMVTSIRYRHSKATIKMVASNRCMKMDMPPSPTNKMINSNFQHWAQCNTPHQPQMPSIHFFNLPCNIFAMSK